ncbi:MAG TPA: hypothetical protein DCL41_09140 [Bdellovibrionales bacterium]|nr:hypothetical protein [Pseudobdellovibrionaceae bacterium]HAG92025.1 hypothetical protein [Bdellovibrionales bacterium]
MGLEEKRRGGSPNIRDTCAEQQTLSRDIELPCDFAHGLQIQRMFPIGQSKETLWGKDFEVGFIGGNLGDEIKVWKKKEEIT